MLAIESLSQLIGLVFRQEENGDVSTTYSKLLVLLLNTGIRVDVVDVVGEKSISGILRDDTQGDNNSKSPSVTLGAQEIKIAGVAVGLGLHKDSLLDFTELKLDSRIASITTSMVSHEDVEGLIRLILADEETRGFGNPPDTTELENGREGLDKSNRPPAPVVGNLGSAPADDGDDCHQRKRLASYLG